MTQIIIKTITAKDLPHVDALQRLTFSKDLLEPLSLFQEMLNHSPQTHVIAMSADQPAGYAFAHPINQTRRDFEAGCGMLTGAEDAYYLHDLCVSPNFRGQGIAKAIFDAQKKIATNLGFTKILGVSVQNSAHFWEKLGFVMQEPYCYMGVEGYYMTLEL